MPWLTLPAAPHEGTSTDHKEGRRSGVTAPDGPPSMARHIKGDDPQETICMTFSRPPPVSEGSGEQGSEEFERVMSAQVGDRVLPSVIRL